MICLYSDYSLRMSKYISTSKKYINDPKLRCHRYYGTDKKSDAAVARRAYEESMIQLPSIWSWKYLTSGKLTHAAATARRDTTPYFPFNETVYKFATGASTCDWSHTLPMECKDTDATYNFPCGCENPRILFASQLEQCSLSTSALLSAGDESGLCVEVPCCPVFAQGATPKKRKRRKSKLSLTDNRTYSRLVRSRSKKAAKPSKGCSKQLMDDDEPTDSE